MPITDEYRDMAIENFKDFIRSHNLQIKVGPVYSGEFVAMIN